MRSSLLWSCLFALKGNYESTPASLEVASRLLLQLFEIPFSISHIDLSLLDCLLGSSLIFFYVSFQLGLFVGKVFVELSSCYIFFSIKLLLHFQRLLLA